MSYLLFSKHDILEQYISAPHQFQADLKRELLCCSVLLLWGRRASSLQAAGSSHVPAKHPHSPSRFSTRRENFNKKSRGLFKTISFQKPCCERANQSQEYLHKPLLRPYDEAKRGQWKDSRGFSLADVKNKKYEVPKE